MRAQSDLDRIAVALNELATAVAAMDGAVRKLQVALLSEPSQVTDQPERRPGDYLTTREVAELFRTSESTIRYWRHKGIGPRSFRVGRRVLYDPLDVEAHIGKLRGDAPAETPATRARRREMQ